MPDENPFVRFKHHVNNHIASGFQRLIGLPSVVSRGWAHNRGQGPPSLLHSSNSHASGQGDVYPFRDDIEEILDEVRSRHDPDASRFGLGLFLLCSAYSPVLLDSTLDWKPTPNRARDAGGRSDDDDDDNRGSFQDAFLDLLLASSAAPMAPTTPAYRAWKRRTSPFATKWASLSYPSEDDLYDLAFKCKEYEKLICTPATGLMEVYFPIQMGPLYRSPATMDEWVARRQKEWAPSQAKGDAMLAVWASKPENSEPEMGSRWDEIVRRASGGVERGAPEAVRRAFRQGVGERQPEKSQPGEAETEEDLYQALMALREETISTGKIPPLKTRRTSEDMGGGFTKVTTLERNQAEHGMVGVVLQTRLMNKGRQVDERVQGFVLAPAGDKPSRPEAGGRSDGTVDGAMPADGGENTKGRRSRRWFWK